MFDGFLVALCEAVPTKKAVLIAAVEVGADHGYVFEDDVWIFS
jgi:hypothetical protein